MNDLTTSYSSDGYVQYIPSSWATGSSSFSTWSNPDSIELKIDKFLLHFPIVYTIKSVDKIKSNPNLLHITYDGPIEQFKSCNIGTIYIDGIQKYAVWDECGNRYWNNSLIIEFEEEVDTIEIDSRFIIMNQWDDKFTNEELIEMVSNPLIYYNKIHSKLIKEFDPNNIVEYHQKLDSKLNLVEVYD